MYASIQVGQDVRVDIKNYTPGRPPRTHIGTIIYKDAYKIIIQKENHRTTFTINDFISCTHTIEPISRIEVDMIQERKEAKRKADAEELARIKMGVV
jgi:hypothetical protein